MLPSLPVQTQRIITMLEGFIERTKAMKVELQDVTTHHPERSPATCPNCGIKTSFGPVVPGDSFSLTCRSCGWEE